MINPKSNMKQVVDLVIDTYDKKKKKEEKTTTTTTSNKKSYYDTSRGAAHKKEKAKTQATTTTEKSYYDTSRGAAHKEEKKKSSTKSPVSYTTETKKAYEDAKTTANSKTTIKSDLSDNDRKARIKDIESEMTRLDYTLNGLGRANAYTAGKSGKEYLAAKSEEIKKRKAELEAELKSLQRVGTFSASELKQFEIEDAKAEKAKLPNYNPTARIMPHQVESFKQNVQAHSEADKKINLLEREKAELKKYEKLEELNAHTKAVTSKADFAENSKYSPKKPKTEAELKAEGYKQAQDGKWYKQNFFGVADFYNGEDSDLYTYINDENSRLSIGTKREMEAGVNTYEKLGYHTLTNEEKSAFNYLYNQDRQKGTNTAEEYLRKIAPLLEDRAMKLEAERYKKISKEAPVLMSGISLGTNFANALMYPAKVVATATDSYEDMPFLDMYGNRTQAIRGAVSEDMGTVGKLFYNAGMSMGDMGVAMLAGGGNAKVVQAIMSSSAGSSTISQAKNNGASDGKALVLGLGSAAIEWATEKFSIDKLLSDPKTIRGFILENTFTEATEEGASNISNTILDAIVSEVFGERNELEQRIDYLVLYEGYSEEKAFKIATNEKLLSLGEDVLVGGMTGFGMSGVKSIPIAIQRGIDGKNKPTQEEPNETTPTDAQETNATPVEQTTEKEIIEQAAREAVENRNATPTEKRENTIPLSNPAMVESNTAESTLMQAAMETVENRNKQTRSKRAKVTVENLDALTRSNKPITVEEVKQVTGFGDRGATIVTRLANRNGVTFSNVVNVVRSAYKAGATGMTLAQEEGQFRNDVQRKAFEAGMEDRVLQDTQKQAQVKNATVYDGAFTEGEHTKNYTEHDKKMISIVAKALKMDVSATDKILANITFDAYGDEVYHYANASHNDGKMEIASHRMRNKAIYALVLHESGHRMSQLSPTEFGSLMDALYQRAVRLNRDYTFEYITDQHNEAGLKKNTRDNIEEIAVRELETIFSSAEEFNKWYAEISQNQAQKNNVQKFFEWIRKVIDEIKTALSQLNMTAEERAAAKEELEELNRIKDLLANTLKSAEKTATELSNNVQAKQDVTENATTKETQSTDNELSDFKFDAGEYAKRTDELADFKFDAGEYGKSAERKTGNAQEKSSNNLEIETKKEYNGNVNYSLYNEYNTIGMQWAYSSSTEIGDLKVLYKARTGKFVLVEATKEDVGFIELKVGTYKQLQKDVELYESNKEGNFTDNERNIDKAIHNFETGQNNNNRDNVNVGNRGTGIQDAEVLEGKSKSNGTTNSQASNRNLDKTSFSLQDTVEETKDLIAVHNLWEEKLLKSLKLGGFPMPSIAIVRAKEGHNNFGNISLVFRKETISPTDRRNKVYSGDAWTPTYPHIEYKLNEKEQSKIENRINNLVPKDVKRAFGGLHLDSYNMEHTLNRSGELVSSYKNNGAMKYAFLKESGVEFELPMKDAELSRKGVSNEAIIKIAETVPEEVLRNAIEGDSTDKKYESEPAIRDAIAEAIREKYKDKPEWWELLSPKEELNLGTLMDCAEGALRYKEEGIKQEIDYKEASDLVNEKTDTAQYEKWLKDLFSNIIAKEGIRNDKDLFTPSGNRRSFEALHYEHTLENVVKAMKESGTIGIGGWGGNNILGSSAVEYSSISEIKEKANERMKSLPQEEYDKIREGFTDRFFEIANSLPIHKDFSATDDAANMLCEAVLKYKTRSGMANYLRNESKGWANYSDHIVDDLIELVNDIRNMPTSYFEAKPQRAVGFNEIAMAIIPDNVSEELKTKLTENKINFVEYENGNNEARLKALNSLEDVNFSLIDDEPKTSSKDTKALLETIEHLKNEFKVTKFAKADPKKLAKLTKDLLKEYSSKGNYDETYKAIDELYQYIANGEDGQPAVWEDVYSRASEIAKSIIESAVVVDDEMYVMYKGLRDYLRKTPMKFDSRYDSVPSDYENFREFKRRNWGRLNFTNDGVGVDGVYQELAGLYPEFFDADEQINVADQLERIVDVLDQLKPREINPHSRGMSQAISYLANDIIDRFFDVPQAKPTFADKAERRVMAERIKGNKKVEAVRQQKDEQIQKLIERQRDKTKKQIEKLREQRDARVKKEQQKRREAISKLNETQKAKVLRAQIARHAGDLSKKLVSPTDNQHIPDDLKGVVAKLLECINLESNYSYHPESHSYKKDEKGLPTRRTEAFNELKDIYEEIASSVVVDPDLIAPKGLLWEVSQLKDKRIADMSSTELQTVWDAVRAIEASVNTANKVFSQGKFETILEFAESLREDNAGKRPRIELTKWAGGGIKRLAQLYMLTPETYFHYLGDAGDSIFRMMRDAQDKHISIMKEVADFTRKTLKNVDVNSLEKTMHTVKFGGKDVKLSTAQLMELYALMKREQAIEHILVGGILPDTTKNKLNPKLNVSVKAIRNLSIAEITEALSNLTDEQKKIADALQKFVSTTLSEYGNEASMKVYNYEKFTEKNYWTLRINKKDLSNKEVGEAKKVVTVANKGMAKGTKPHANNSVRIGSIFDTFAAHSSDMATYSAWLGTSEDVNRIRNFVFWENGARVESIEDILDTVHGAYESKGSKYLEKLLEDISIGVKGTDNMNPFDKLIGNYKAASVGANVRVVIQQPTAILRAMDMIGSHYLAAGAINPLKGWEKAKKYAPIAQWKDWGHFDINTGRQMKDVLFDNASLLEKTKQVGMWGASMMDSLAWGQLWNAVEAETKAKHKALEVGSEEYYETVAKRFTEIVDHTQVVDGIMQRSQIMRSPDALTKMATSFMGEPTKQYNMAVAAAYDAINSKGETRKKAVARLGRTAMSLVVAGLVNACAQSIVDAMRDDDKEKDYWEKWLAAFKGGEDDKWFQKFGNLGDTFNPLSYIPYAKDIVSVFAGYDVKRMDMEAISKTWNAVTNLYKSITGTGKYTIAKASIQLVAEASRLWGLPVANVKRDIKSIATTIAIETDSYVLQYRMEKAMLDIKYAYNNKNFTDILFNAYNNDKEAYEFIYNDMIKSGFDVDKIKSGIETRLKDAEGVESVKDLSKRYMTPAAEKKYNSSLKKIQSSDVWKSANATQRKDAQAVLYSYLTSTSDEMKETRAETKKVGIDETEYVLWQLAKAMADNDGKDELSAKEKETALKLLDLDSKTEWDLFLFKLAEDKNKGIRHAISEGVSTDTYVAFREALYAVDRPNKNGDLGTYDQDEATLAVKKLKGLTQKEKRALYQSVNIGWKNNPF